MLACVDVGRSMDFVVVGGWVNWCLACAKGVLGRGWGEMDGATHSGRRIGSVFGGEGSGLGFEGERYRHFQQRSEWLGNGMGMI